MRTPNRRPTQPSIPPSQPSPSSSSSRPALLSLLALALCLSSVATTAEASITCALPAGGTYKAGDSIILDWGSDGTMPVVTDIASINGTLFCNSGSKIADVSIPNLTGPFNWTVPGVGNATTVGGNQGVCPMNAFHIEYSGEAWGFLHAIKSAWGPVRCGTITITPAENGTVAAVILTLSIVGLVWYLRKQKKRRLANALGPWSLESNSNLHVSNAQHHSRFSKVSTMDNNNIDDDEPHGSPSASNNRPAMAAIGGAAAGFAMKPQPSVPGSNRTSRQQQQQGYYDEGDFANYGYQQQQQLLNQGQGGFNNSGYHLPAGYTDGNGGNGVMYQNPNISGQVDGVAEDDYYNPYYAHRQSLQQQQQYQQLQMLGLNASNPSFYSQSNASHTSGMPRPYSGEVRFSQHGPEQLTNNGHGGAPGYFPPPPPKSNARGGQGAVGMTLPTGSALSLSNSPKRGPQGANVMSEMGSREAAADGGGPEKVLVQEGEANKAVMSDDEDVETTPLTTGTTVTSATAAIFDEEAKESS
ncbi:hypothetical protein BGZ93_001082 [Podila epicladia]|nr:hypothetical protein BGZ93_001082 [Podila epicladia]KAG0087145.1 hypothetical protein BGZ92_007569 [Podila epicladia]